MGASESLLTAVQIAATMAMILLIAVQLQDVPLVTIAKPVTMGLLIAATAVSVEVGSPSSSF